MRTKVGDRVRFKAEFLRSIFVVSGTMPLAKGTVKKVLDVGKTKRQLVIIDWDIPHMPEKVLSTNLEKA